MLPITWLALNFGFAFMEMQVFLTRLEDGTVTVVPADGDMLLAGGIAPGAMLDPSASVAIGQVSGRWPS